MAITNEKASAAASIAARKAEEAAKEKRAMGTTKDSGAVPENEKKIRGLHTAKEAAKNSLLKAGFAGAGAAVAQAARAGRNRLRRSK